MNNPPQVVQQLRKAFLFLDKAMPLLHLIRHDDDAFLATSSISEYRCDRIDNGATFKETDFIEKFSQNVNQYLADLRQVNEDEDESYETLGAYYEDERRRLYQYLTDIGRQPREATLNRHHRVSCE